MFSSLVGPARMPFAKHSRRLTLLVLVAYLAAGTLAVLCHEHVHSHVTADACCHAHQHEGHGSQHHSSPLPAKDQSGPRLVVTAAAHDCFICRVTAQPIVTAVAASVELSASVTPDALPSPAAAPRTLAARLAQSRAPPAAVI